MIGFRLGKKICCSTCGGEMTQKSKARLISVGLCMLASVAIAFVFPWFSAPGTGIYLLVWATLGKACWCRIAKNSV
jgi:hypothetical protein